MYRQLMLSSLLIALAAGPVAAELKESKAAKLLGHTRAEGSLPIWSKPTGDALRDLGRVARGLESAVMLVGSDRGGWGTGWVLSKKHRLLATNAHIADIGHGRKLFAVASGTSTAYKVEKIWYHPGVRRHMNENRHATIRSMDPKDGDVECASPDLAILQLSSYGPDLPAEFPLATPDELKELFAQPVAMFGFPGHDSDGLPRIGENVNGTFHAGVVSRITDFHGSTTVSAGELQLIQHTIQSFGGFSGSPIFLPNGHVVAIHNSGGGRVDRGTHVNLSWGIRVDALWEMLVHHSLDSKVSATIDKDKLLLARYRERDERDEEARANLAKARALVDEAADLIDFREDFRGAADKCIEARTLAPGYAPAYYSHSAALTNYWVMMSEHLSQKDAVETLLGALKHAKTCAQLAPTDPGAIICVSRCRINLAIVTDDRSEAENALAILNELMKTPGLSTDVRADAHSALGTAYGCLGENEAAREHHNEAVRLAPTTPVFWSNRGNFWSYTGRHDLAERDYAKARALREKAMSK
jgi:hypothetical protein